MSDNPISSPNEVSTKSTFEDWRQITNQIIKRLNSLYSESGANGTPDDNLSVYNDAKIGASGFGNLEVTGNIKVKKDLIIGNDLIVKGSTTTVNTVDLIVKDRMVELNHDPFYRNHPYDSKLKSGFQVHIGVDDNNITTSYVNHENGSVTNQIQNIQYQIDENDENDEYEIDNDKTVITMSYSAPEATLHFNSLDTRWYTVGHIVEGEISGVKALVTNTLFNINNSEYTISVNYLEEETSFQIGEKVTQETWTQSQIDQYSGSLVGISQIDNNFSLSSLDFSNKKYLLRFRDTQGDLEPTEMFFVDSYDVSQNELVVIGNVSGYTEYTNLKFDIQEIKTQRLYWDENSEKWVIDTDLNVLGDIYSNGSVLWRVNPLDSSEIYYNDKVKIGTTLSLNDWNITPRTAENVLDFKFDTTNIFSLSNSGNFLSLYGTVGAEDGHHSSPQYTFKSDPNTGMYLSAPDNLSFSSGGNKRLTVKTDGVGVFGGLQLLSGEDASDSGGTIRYFNSDFEGRRLIGGELQWVSLTQSNSSGYSSVYSKFITDGPAWVKLNIPNSTSIESEHYLFDFYGYSQSETPNSDNISQYKFYVNIRRIDSNTKTSEVIIKRIKSSSGVEEFEFYKIIDNNDNVIIYAKMPQGFTGIDILQTGSDEGYFEPLSNAWFSTLFIEPTELSGVNPLDVGNLTSQWEHNPTDESKIYYDGGATGFVGIGVSDPLTHFHVDGTIRSDDLATMPDPNPDNVTGYALYSNQSQEIKSSTITFAELNQLSGIDTTGQTIEERFGGLDTSKWTKKTDNTIYRNTKVGVGDFSSTNLTEKLEVDGNIKSTGYISLPEGVGSGIKFKVDVNETETDKALIYYLNSTENLILKSENDNPTSLIIGNEKLLLNYDSNTYEVLHEDNFATLKLGYAENNQNYPVEEGNGGKLFVNVPWVDTDTDTTYTAGEGLSLVPPTTGTEFRLDPATSQTLGGIKLTTSPETEVWSHPHYAVKLDSDSRAYVTVPWTDKWSDAHATSGIYRDSKIGIGDFSTTALTEKLEVDGNIKLTEDLGLFQNHLGEGRNLIFKNKFDNGSTDFEMNTIFSQGYDTTPTTGDGFFYKFSSDYKDISNPSNNVNTVLYEYIQGLGSITNGNHNFTGNVTVTENITTTGTITSETLITSEKLTLGDPVTTGVPGQDIILGTEGGNIHFCKKVDTGIPPQNTPKAGPSIFITTDFLKDTSDPTQGYITVDNCVFSTGYNSSEGVNFQISHSDTNSLYTAIPNLSQNEPIIYREHGVTLPNTNKEPKLELNTHVDILHDLIVGGTITSNSDITLKENLEIIENPIEKIKEINGYTYNMVGKDKRSAGLVAQEVEKVLPEVVSKNSDGIKSLAYGNIVALLVETVKEQQKQIDELKKQISDK